jgi:predicted nuclease of predicted toxin-antitoxin system
MSDSTLRFMADENCDFAVVRALRSQGFDVLAVSEYTSRSDDRVLIEQSFKEQRILLTEDKDFGWLVYVSHVESAGVILMRYPGNRRTGLVSAVVQLVKERSEEIRGRFVVIQPGRVRIGRRP